MNSVRRAPSDCVFPHLPCSRCSQQAHQHWDRIAGKSFCASCEEDLVLGDAEPLVERTDRHRCAVCGHVGTLCFQSFPLNSNAPVEIDLCGEHLRALLSRSLQPEDYHKLLRRLALVGLDYNDLFLLHDEFYDADGQALKPAVEW